MMVRVHDVVWPVDDDDDEDIGRPDSTGVVEMKSTAGRGDATMQCCVPGILVAPVRRVRADANRCD